jgi:hypothetical protein
MVDYHRFEGFRCSSSLCPGKYRSTVDREDELGIEEEAEEEVQGADAPADLLGDIFGELNLNLI